MRTWDPNDPDAMRPPTVEEYAQVLVERFGSMRKDVGDRRLRQIFLGAKAVVPTWLPPKVFQEVTESYAIAEKALFPEDKK